MSEPILEKSSYSLIRTNPKLSGNVKLLYDDQNLFLESFDANDELSKSRFKSFRISGDSTYDKDVWKFFKSGTFPKELAYEVNQKSTDYNVLSKYKNQYETFYGAGVKENTSKSYNKELSVLAPIWLKQQIPNYFVVFKLNQPSSFLKPKEENAFIEKAKSVSGFRENILNHAHIIKTFDLRENTKIGSYLRRYINQPQFPLSPLTVSYRRDESILWNGISYEAGGFTSIGNYSYEDLIIKDSPIIQNEYFFTKGFQRNGVLCANLINLEFLFNDEYSNDYEINRYFGLYVNIIKEGDTQISARGFYENLEKTQIPKIETKDKINDELNQSLEIKNKEGVLIYYDTDDINEITGIPTKERINEVDSFFYIKDKRDNLYSIKRNSDWGNNQLRIYNNKVNIKNFTGFIENELFSQFSIIEEKQKAFFSINVLDEIQPGAKISFYDGDEFIAEIAGTDTLGIPSGKNLYKFFNPKGLVKDIAKSIVNSINNGIPIGDRFFEASYNGSTVYIRSRVSGKRFNKLSVKINYDSYPELEEQIEISQKPSNDKLPFIGGTDYKRGSFKISIENESYFKKGDWIKTKQGYSRIVSKSPYLLEPILSNGNIIGYKDIDKYKVIITEGRDILITEQNQISIYKEFRMEFGRLSIFPIKDFDFDFYSNRYSDKGELEFEEEYYKDSENPDVNNFYELGFSNLVGVLEDSSPDFDLIQNIQTEYDRLDENFNKSYAITSRTVPFINKWGWVNEGKDVRNNPYRLNLNESFGLNNFSPSKYDISQNQINHSHEWYYLSYPPHWFSEEAIKNSWSYTDFIINDSYYDKNFNYVPGTFQRIDDNLFDKIFINDNIYHNSKIISYDKQIRYSRFFGGDSENYPQSFLRGVKIIAKPKSSLSKGDDSYVKNEDLNDYKFSCILVPNEERKPETQIKIVKNDKWKTIVLMVFVQINDPCLDEIDRTILYSYKNNYKKDSSCNDLIDTDGSYKYNDGFLQGSIDIVGSSLRQNNNNDYDFIIRGMTDINGNPTKFIRDIRIGTDGTYTPIRFKINGNDFLIDNIVSVLNDDTFIAKTIKVNGSTVNNIPGGLIRTVLKTTDFILEEKGYREYETIFREISFSSIYDKINNNDPSIVWETIDKNGNPLLDERGEFLQDFSIELRAQDDIIKSIYLKSIEDPNKPTIFNNIDVIGYVLSLQENPRVSLISRHSGYYEPIFKDLVFFKDPYIQNEFVNSKDYVISYTTDYDNTDTDTDNTATTDTDNTANTDTDNTASTDTDDHTGMNTHTGLTEDLFYKDKVFNLVRFKNSQFDLLNPNFGIIHNFFYHKVNTKKPSSILELSDDNNFKSLYPLINEIGIDKTNFYIWSSNWDPGYFFKNIDKNSRETVIGTRSMNEFKSFFGSKNLKTPFQISINQFSYSENFNEDLLLDPFRISEDIIIKEGKTTLEFNVFFTKSLINIFKDRLKDNFKKWINPEFSFGKDNSLDDDIREYITQNILKRYKIENIDLWTKKSNERNYLFNLDVNDKIERGFGLNKNFTTKKLNSNPFDFVIIYNKKLGYRESFSLGITFIKK